MPAGQRRLSAAGAHSAGDAAPPVPPGTPDRDGKSAADQPDSKAIAAIQALKSHYGLTAAEARRRYGQLVNIGQLDDVLAGIARTRTALANGLAEERACPQCGGPMVARRGPHGAFYGCRRFPECRGTLEIEAGIITRDAPAEGDAAAAAKYLDLTYQYVSAVGGIRAAQRWLHIVELTLQAITVADRAAERDTATTQEAGPEPVEGKLPF